MRRAFANAVLALADRPNFYFLTGDLGFMALEEVRDALGSRFINAGVAEQNMVGVAAGLAKAGCEVMIYSIAPFCYARPFEQIRNDLCIGGLSVCLVGNGGGYGYGHMGPTHHALEDCAVMRALGVRVLVPSFDEDLPALLKDVRQPTYLRLGYDARPSDLDVPQYQPWREVLVGQRGNLVAMGPLAGVALQAYAAKPESKRPSVWAVSEWGNSVVPDGFWDHVQGRELYVVEEHVAQGGLGSELALMMAQRGITARGFFHRFALRYPSGRFGSQAFHRRECGLDAESLADWIAL